MFMKKRFYLSGIICFLFFLFLLFNYKSTIIIKFDEWAKSLIYGNDVIAFFHYLGEPKIIIFVVCLLCIVLLFMKRQYGTILFVIMNVGIGYFINQEAKKIIMRPRPEIVNQLSTYSFPSGHAMLGLLYIFTLCYVMTEKIKNRKKVILVWIIGIAVTILIGLSRIAESRHFASDVLAGWFLGFAWFTLCVYVYERLKRKK